MFTADLHIKSLVSFAPSCSKYQSPLDELARISVFPNNPDHRINVREEEKKCASFRPCIPTAVDYLAAYHSFRTRSLLYLASFPITVGILISDRPENIVVSKTHYDSGHFIICFSMSA